MPEPVRIFISYRREDTRHVAGRLGDRLIGEKFTVFMDIETIVPGMDFTAAVRQAVDESDVLLALIGSSWLTLTDSHGRRRLDNPDDWVVQEISIALQRGIVVIPLLVDGVSMPDPSELPAALVPLASRQALALRHESFTTDAERLVEAIRRLGGRIGQAGRQRELQESYETAMRAGREGRWSDAVSGLTAVVTLDATYKDAALRLDQAKTRVRMAQLTTELREHVRAGRWARAVQAGDAIVRIDPRYPDPEGLLRQARIELERDQAQRYDVGVRLLSQGQWEPAGAQFASIVAERPAYRDAAALLARAQHEQRLLMLHRAALEAETSGRWADAVRALEAMQATDPAYADGAARLARARARLGVRGGAQPSGPGGPAKSGVGRILLISGIALAAVLVIIIVLAIIGSLTGPPGGGGSRSSASSPDSVSSTPTASTSSTDQQQLDALRAKIPTSFSQTCEPYTTTNQYWSLNLVVALRCRPGDGGPTWAIYYQYDSTASAVQAYRSIMGADLPRNDCTKTPGEQEYVAYDVNKVERPVTLGCTDKDPVNNQSYVWVDKELGIVTNAWDAKLTFAQLKTWWEQAGPYKR